MGHAAPAARVAVLTPVMPVTMPDWLSLSIVLGGAVVSAVVLLIARRRLAGTTMVAPGAWALVSIVSIVAIETAIYLLGDGISLSNREALRWTATCSTLCPMMAQLGAKRPQNRAWQWIVLSLWVILALPAGESLLLGRGVQISTARWVFTWALVAIGFLNMLPTRYWLSALLVAAGQSVLLLGYARGTADGATIGMGLFAIAAVAAYWSAGRGRDTETPLDRAWLDFRDMFGVVWAVRIAEQLNKSSAMHDWNVAARWDGLFDAKSGEPVTGLMQETAGAIERSLRTQLRRFVSPAWLDARLPTSRDEADAP
jgi:hypothetical protein